VLFGASTLSAEIPSNPPSASPPETQPNVLFGAFCYAELGAAMPEAGGDYVYLSRGLSPVWGFLYGWTSSMIMRPGGAAVTAAGLLRFTGFLLPSVANPIFTWHLTLPFQLQPYQFTFTAAQPLAAGTIVLVTAINYLRQGERSPSGRSIPAQYATTSSRLLPSHLPRVGFEL
jgi:hypothetical protein